MRKHRSRVREISPKKTVFSVRAILIGIAVLLCFIGLIFVFEASSIRALGETGDSFHYLKLQVRWIGIGILLIGFFSWYNFKNLYYLALPALLSVIV
ncbi:hypothetical protein KBD81_02010, partial [Candidatus Woesebacteria bacterium]|nr:hypothetical protein [Candidatus Woesebacteria bacterium]